VAELIKMLSLGAGVQSTALLLLSVEGILPKLDYAVFADTGWEPQEVYDHLDWLQGVAEKAGITVARVSHGNLRENSISELKNPKTQFMSVPVFLKSEEGAKISMGRRQCTREYKVAPIETYLRQKVLGLKPRQRAPKEAKIEQWIGISADEAQRAKDSRVPWKVHVFPFLGFPSNYLDKPWKRADCIRYLQANHGDRAVPRSACIGCPFHSNAEWRSIKADPVQWADALEFDRAIRNPGRGPSGQQFLHRDCVPLDEVDLRTDAELGQLDLWGNECEGMCGL
jgi:hypothetical protein